MRSYGESFIPKEKSQYTLKNASFSDKRIVIGDGGGSIQIDFKADSIKSLTEYLRLSILAAPSSDGYTPTVTACIEASTKENKEYFNILVNVLCIGGASCTKELEFLSGEYASLRLTITAKEMTAVSLIELCKESSGETEAIIDGVKQSLPRLLADYNNVELQVKQTPVIIAMIACRLVSDTDLQGHFLISCYVSEYCTIHLRFFDSGAVELFSPVLHTLRAGYNTVEVPHAYLKRRSGLHNFYVTAQVTNGSLSIPVRSLLYTIDGGYLAQRLMDPGMHLDDLSIRQVQEDDEPSEIWAIGHDLGKITVKKHPYDASISDTWETVWQLVEGKASAIEFNGTWQLRGDAIHHTLITEDIPVVAYIDTEDILWVKQGGADAEAQKFAEKATCVSMVRGYSSIEYPEQDQGLIVAWIAEKKAYYRQFAYLDEKVQWLPIEQFNIEEEVSYIQVHRLNDYRVGFLIQTDKSNLWYISERTYVVQAVPAELMSAAETGIHLSFAMTKKEHEAVSFEAFANDLSGATEAQDTFTVTFPFPKKIGFLNGSYEAWRKTIKFNVRGKAFYDYTVSIEGNVISFKTRKPVYGTVDISWNYANLFLYLDEKRFLINLTTSYSFHWEVKRIISVAYTDAATAAVTGKFIVTPRGKLKLKNIVEEATHVETTGIMSVVAAEKQKPRAAAEDQIDVVAAGQFTVSALLTGEQPI